MGNSQAEHDNRGADGDDSDGVSAAPEHADERRFEDGALAADDGGDGDDVIGIGGVAHAEHQADD